MKGKKNKNGPSKPSKPKSSGGNSYINAEFFIRGKASGKGKTEKYTNRIVAQVVE